VGTSGILIGGGVQQPWCPPPPQSSSARNRKPDLLRVGVDRCRISSLQSKWFMGHFGFLNDALPLLVFLALFKGLHVFPPEDCLAAVAIHIRHSMKSSDEDSILFRPQADVDHIAEEESPAMSSLKSLGDNLVMLCQMCPAIAAAVDPRTTEIDLEHFAHVYDWSRR